MAPGSSSMTGWLGASMALHLLAAGAWLDLVPSTASDGAAPVQSLSLQLVNAKTEPPSSPQHIPRTTQQEQLHDTAQPAETHRAVPVPRKASIPAPMEEPMAERKTSTAPAPRSPASAASQAKAPARADQHHLQQELREQLLNLVSEQLHYPAMARRRGWEGVVLLRLRLHPSGEIQDLQVMKTSGYPLLDRAAHDDLRRLARVPDAGDRLQGRPLDMTLPIRYRLVDS